MDFNLSLFLNAYYNMDIVKKTLQKAKIGLEVNEICQLLLNICTVKFQMIIVQRCIKMSHVDFRSA